MEQKKRNVNVYNLLIIDESGSMSRIYDQALSGINETLNVTQRVCSRRVHAFV